MKIVTKPEFTRALSLVALTCGMLTGAISQTFAQTDQDLIEVARSVVKADREAAVVAAMELTDAESKNFWPLYHEYRFEMDKVDERLMRVVLEYGKLYPTVSDDRARQMLKDFTGFQQKQVDKRTSYFKKFSKVLPAAKALRFAQVETCLDLQVQLQMAARVPLMPVY